MKKSSIFLLGLVIFISTYDLLGQTSCLHSFITETNQSHYNGVITDGIYLYGTKYDGGEYGKGYVYKVKNDNTGYEILIHFDGRNKGSNPAGSLLLSGNMLYGMAYSGGLNDYGTLYKIKTDGSAFQKLLDFNNTNGGNSFSSLIIDGTTLYGALLYGGLHGVGAIFKINTDGGGYVNLHSFETTDGWGPSSPL